MTDEETAIVLRILNVLPARSFELQRFLSIFRVRLDRSVPTACVTCKESPELVLNPDFLAEHCQSDEHLFMLVMHELHHVLLGHTRLFPRSTKLLNLIFDAVINAMLCQRFPDEAYTSFLTSCYPADEMPYALLRPPAPDSHPAAREALKILYGGDATGTYHDVYLALETTLSGLDGEMLAEDILGRLLGSHGALVKGRKSNLSSSGDMEGGAGKDGNPGDGKSGKSEEADSPETSSELAELLHDILSKWPSPDKVLAGRDLGHAEREQKFNAEVRHSATIARAVRRLLRHATTPGVVEQRRRGVQPLPTGISTFLPTPRDRSHEAREILQGSVLLYRDETACPRTVLRDNRRAFVYLDVSGSVAAKVPLFAEILEPYVRRKLCLLHVFSTVVAPATTANPRSRTFHSTGGTDINCILRHVLGLPPRQRPHTIVVITDGFTGKPEAGLERAFRAARLRCVAGILDTPESHLYDPLRDLRDFAAPILRLD